MYSDVASGYIKLSGRIITGNLTVVPTASSKSIFSVTRDGDEQPVSQLRPITISLYKTKTCRGKKSRRRNKCQLLFIA